MRGALWGSMELLKWPTRKILGQCFNISALNLFCRGCVLEILMKSKELMRNWEGLFSLRNKCKISEIA